MNSELYLLDYTATLYFAFTQLNDKCNYFPYLLSLFIIHISTLCLESAIWEDNNQKKH